MKVQTKSFAKSQDEQEKARDYWSKETAQRLTYVHYSHYSRALAEITEQSGAKSVFEFGCAAGRNLDAIKHLAKRQVRLAGCDVNGPFVARGVSDFGLDLIVGDEHSLAKLKSSSFDIAFTVSVLDHIPEPIVALKELVRIAKNAVVLIEPNSEKDSGKVVNVKNEWTNRTDESSNPFTYLHHYPALFKKLDLKVYAEAAMPTHLNRMGPLYTIYVVHDTAPTAAERLKWDGILRSANALAILQLLKNQSTSNQTHTEEMNAIKKLLNSVKTENEKVKAQFAKAEHDRTIKTQQLDATQQTLNRFRANFRELQEKFQKKDLALKDTRAKVQSLKGSTKYKVGKAIVAAATFPVRIFTGKKKSKNQSVGSTKNRERGALAALAKVSKPIRPPIDYGKEFELACKLIPPPNENAMRGNRVIMYVLHQSLPFANGGYATRSQGVAKGLLSNSVAVTCVTRPGFPLDLNSLANTTLPLGSTVIDGVNYDRILEPTVKGRPYLEYVQSSANALERKISELKPSAVVAASNAEITALPALIASRRSGIPFYYEVRGFWEVTRASRESSYNDTEKYDFTAKMEALVCENASHVFTLNAPMKEELVKRGIDASRISLVPNSCEVERFTPRVKDFELCGKLGIPDDAVVIGYIGTFVDYEGLEDLVAAAGALRRSQKSFRLLLVGSEKVVDNSEGPVSQKIQATIEAEGLEDHVIMPGRVPHEEVASYYSLIDIAPFPRKPWPVCEMVSPLKPLEAMAMQKAVVVSSVRALAEMVDHGNTGMIYPKGDTESLAECLSQLIEDVELRKSLGKKSRAWVENERTWVKSTQAMTERFISDAEKLAREA